MSRRSSGDRTRGLNEKRSGDAAYAGGSPDDLRSAVRHYEQALLNLEYDSLEAKEIRDRLNQILSIPYPKIIILLSRGTRPYHAFQRFLSHPALFLGLLFILIIVSPLFNPVRQLVNSYTCGDTISIRGSTAFFPLINQAITSYRQGECSVANFTTSQNSSTMGLKDVYEGNATIGASDIFADPSQTDPKLVDKGKHPLVDHQVAAVIFVLAVNTSVLGICNLSTSQIRGIYSGGYVSWDEVLQAADSKPCVHTGDLATLKTLGIKRIDRPLGSGTRATFEKYVLGGTETVSGPPPLESDSNQSVAQSICDNPGAIGYISLYHAKQDQFKKCLRILSIDHFSPTDPHIVDLIIHNNYTFWNIEHLYTSGTAMGLAQKFIDYMHSDSFKQYFKQDYYLDLKDIANALPSHSLV